MDNNFILKLTNIPVYAILRLLKVKFSREYCS